MPKPVADLQGQLFKSLGIGQESAPSSGGSKSNRNGRGAGRPVNRKDQRKAQRAQKKGNTYAKNQPGPSRPSQPTQPNRPVSKSVNGSHAQPASILKKPGSSKRHQPESDSDDDLDGGSDVMGDFNESDGLEDDEVGEDDMSDEEEMHFDEDEEEEDVDRSAPKSSAKGKVKSAVQEKLDEDDAEIAALERKLGIKKGRKSLPQSFKDDGLSDLLGDMGGGDEEEEEESEGDSGKRKREFDDWLASKRQKTAAQPYRPKQAIQRDEDDDDEDDFDEDIEDPWAHDNDDDSMGSDDEGDFDDEFDGFDSEGETSTPAQPRVRENPYVAPTTGAVVAKYVPPSLRKKAGEEEESMARLRRQVQGLINRLTDDNILTVVRSVEELYQNNARGDVTEVLTDAIMAQVCKPEALPDQFFVLTGGFAAAIYKIIGSSFGSHLIRRVVKDFGEEYDRASAVQHEESAIPKEPSNLITLLSQLYVFEVVGCKIIFDYMQRLMADLSEINVELLLRICRNGGRLLRRDDPQALKSVSNSLNKSVAKAENATVSVRTKFIVETINDLRNKKAKGKGMDSAVVSESVVRMKKRLGEIKSQSRRLDGITAMGVDLEDIISADTRGKWWLVGASVPVKPEKTDKNGDTNGKAGPDDDDSDNEPNMASDAESEDMDFVLPDYPNKARAQGLGTPGQIAIFTALMTAADFETGYRQYLNLKLKKEEQLEIARVLVQCVGSETEYNPYYAAVGERACSNSRVRFAFQSRLWQIFKAMGESLFGEDEQDDMETSDGVRFKDEGRVRRVGQFYAALIAEGGLRMSILKPLSPHELEKPTALFMQSFLVSLLQNCKSKKPEKQRLRVQKAFGSARETPKLAAGLEWFLREKIRKTKLVSGKELRKLEEVKEQARAILGNEAKE